MNRYRLIILATMFALVGACGTEAPMYSSGSPAAAGGEPKAPAKAGGNAPAVANNSGASKPDKAGAGPISANKTVPGATSTMPPATTSNPPATTSNPPATAQANLVAQGTPIYNLKCMSCHGTLAQKATDPRAKVILNKTAAQIGTAKAKTAHAGLQWPVGTELNALEAVLK